MHQYYRRILWVAAGAVLLLSLMAAGPARAETAAVTCANFDSLVAGTRYEDGDSFTANGIAFKVVGGGFVDVENGGLAGGSGLDLEINNVALTVDFAAMPNVAPVDAASFIYGEYGGYVKLQVNADIVQKEDYPLFDGDVQGGAAITVVGRGAPELGALAAQGTIGQFGLFGQELWVDNLCLRKGQTAEPEPGLRPDLGDAPDSTNHVGIQNTAYPGVPGRFPTVWEGTPAGAGTGPKHRNPSAEAILGNAISAEADADPSAADTDGMNNILNGSNDNANNDRFDDGWRNRGVPLPHCSVTFLRTRIQRAASSTQQVMYLNVWYDGNSDGDWEDSEPCFPGEDVPAALDGSEWIVRNRPIVVALIPAGGFVDFPIVTSRIYNPNPAQPGWMRFTLAETPVIPHGAGLQPDGRGPAFPNAYRFGETEDYLRAGDAAGQPGTVRIQKSQQGTNGGTVQAGDVFTYTIRLQHDGGTAPASARLRDPLPPGVQLAGPVRVSEETPQAGPLVAAVANRTVEWQGHLSPGAVLRVEIPVRARRCIGQPVTLTNTANVQQPDQPAQEASVQTVLACLPENPPVVVKRILEDQGGALVEVVEADIVPGAGSAIRFKATNPTGRDVVIRLRDPLPDGMVAIEGGAPVTTVVRTLLLPAGQTASVDVPVRLARRAEGEQELVNMARYVNCLATPSDALCSFPVDNDPLVVDTNPVTWTVKGRDLGDAPDSSNHAGAAMSAYPGTPASFPTVFDLAALPVGPAHVQPQLFHLGAQVSREANADIGPDVDGLNNLNPGAGIANRDRHDDGVRVGAIPFAECRRFEFKVRVSIAPAALALLQDGRGYLNAWVDGSRDGDWDDAIQCPPTSAHPQGGPGLEHFVIDFPIDAAALGAGVHIVTVQSTHPVYWPAADAARPAWVRLTLSDRPSVKSFNVGAVSYGDGRGPTPPFRLGETEDSLRRAPTTPGADVAVRKRGVVEPVVTVAADGALTVSYRVRWAIDYRNVGDAQALQVELEDVLISSYVQGSLRVSSLPPLPMDQTGNRLRFDVGALEAGAGGRIIIEAEVAPANAGSPQTNRVRASADNDADASNNESEATATLRLPAPRIRTPQSGVTFDTHHTVRGWSVPGTEVRLFVDGAPAGTSSANADGIWEIEVNLLLGEHELAPVARLGSTASPAGQAVHLSVSTTWPFEPVGLRVSDGTSNTMMVRGVDGRLEADGWTLLLPHVEQETLAAAEVQATSQYTLLVKSNGPGSAVLLMEEEGISYFCGAGSSDGNNIIAILIGLVCQPQSGTKPLVLQMTTDAGVVEHFGSIARLPARTVRNALTGDPIPGAAITLLEAPMLPGANVGAASGSALRLERVLADRQGRYSWGITQTGTMFHVEAPGYQALRVAAGDVNNDGGDLYMMPEVGDEVLVSMTLTDEGFEPPIATLMPGARVRLTNVDIWEHAFRVEIGGLPAAAAASAAARSADARLAPGESIVLPAGQAMTLLDGGNPDAAGAVLVSPFGESPTFLPLVSTVD